MAVVVEDKLVATHMMMVEMVVQAVVVHILLQTLLVMLLVDPQHNHLNPIV